MRNILNHISDVYTAEKQERTHEVVINEIPMSSILILHYRKKIDEHLLIKSFRYQGYQLTTTSWGLQLR